MQAIYIKRFFSKIKKINECWQWTGSKTKCNSGYGQFNYQGKDNLAHRFSWLIHFGTIPKNKLVLHKCDNSFCVNPSHLEIGNQSKNIQDCLKRNRHPSAKLTIKLADDIRKEYSKNDTTHRKLAKKYKISSSGICRILQGKYYVA